MGRFPPASSRNSVWPQTGLTPLDLLAFTRTGLLRSAERLVHGGRKLPLRLDRTWPWLGPGPRFTRLVAIPQIF